MKAAQEADLTDLENQMEHAEFASCHLIDKKNSHRFASCKRKQQYEGVQIANELRSAECIIPLSCSHQPFFQSSSGRPR